MSVAYEPEEMMTVVAARSLANGATCFVGIGLPSAAANLARRLHAPDLMLIYESGTIGAKPDVLPLSIGDGELAETADAVVSVPEVFAYWLGGGRVDVGFLGAAQIDRHGNLNTTVIGPYDSPRVRLPGAGGAPEIAASSAEVFVMARHRPRTFVAELDFVTTPGRTAGAGPLAALPSASRTFEAARGSTRGAKQTAGVSASRALAGGRPRPKGVTRVITDLGVLMPDPAGELILTQLHPGVSVDAVRSATGWPLEVAETVTSTEPPTAEELGVLRRLKQRTERAHAESVLQS